MSRPIQVHVCCFSGGLDDLPRKKQGSMVAVTKQLVQSPRFSIFEATATPTIARTMDRLESSGWIVTTDLPYPWSSAEVTPLGLAKVAKADGGKP